MTDRERIAELLAWSMNNPDLPEVERLIRDAAERGFSAGQKSASENCGSHYAHEMESFPSDFPLVLDAAPATREG